MDSWSNGTFHYISQHMQGTYWPVAHVRCSEGGVCQTRCARRISCYEGMLKTGGAFKTEASAHTLLKRAFEAATAAPDAKRSRGHSNDVQAMTIVSDCYLECQRRGIASRIAAGNGSDGFLGLKRSWDETACRLYAPDMSQLQTLIERLEIDPASLKVHGNNIC